MTARPYCDDWACPALVSCRHHFGRSLDYWAMRQEGGRFQKGNRKAFQEACAEYERDQIRPWMVEAHRTPHLTPTGAWRMPLFVDLTSAVPHV
tara:strand:- start:10940 stop:11218 length:279 start_codon:yes stop_codon:yes gene_type:complete